MREIGYFMAKVKYKLLGNKKEVISEYFRKRGMAIGKRCNICCNIMNTEPFLVSIGDNVTISGDVLILTHDNSISKIDRNKTDFFGRVNIGNNCFIGARSTILYGVTLGNNIIVAAGSVVCNSFSEERIIIGGNPAKKIGTWDSLSNKVEKYGIRKELLKECIEKDEDILIKKNIKK